MEIKLSDNFKITADSMNFILNEYRYIEPRRGSDKQGRYGWVESGFYQTIQGACKAALQKAVIHSDKSNMNEIIKEMKKLHDDIIEATKNLKVEKPRRTREKNK